MVHNKDGGRERRSRKKTNIWRSCLYERSEGKLSNFSNASCVTGCRRDSRWDGIHVFMHECLRMCCAFPTFPLFKNKFGPMTRQVGY